EFGKKFFEVLLVKRNVGEFETGLDESRIEFQSLPQLQCRSRSVANKMIGQSQVRISDRGKRIQIPRGLHFADRFIQAAHRRQISNSIAEVRVGISGVELQSAFE